jgi:hypothetical protein
MRDSDNELPPVINCAWLPLSPPFINIAWAWSFRNSGLHLYVMIDHVAHPSVEIQARLPTQAL